MASETRLDTYNNAHYRPGSPLRIALWYVVNALVFNSAWFPFSAFKRQILRMFGARIGKGVVLKPHLNIKYPWKLEVGDFSWIGEYVWIDNLDRVVIGSHCCISQRSYLLCGNHNYKKSSFDLQVSSIVLEQGVWIGASCVVLPGVHAGTHAVCTAGSVVSGVLRPYGIYAGNPATYKKQRVIE